MNLATIRANLEEKEHKKVAANLLLFQKASSDAQQIIQMIIHDFQPKRIIQWGSLLNQDQFNEISDIDIAVEGITDAEPYFELIGKAMDITSFPIDIVQLEKIEPEFAEIILAKGKIVYEHP